MVYLIGAGCGNKDLITVKGLFILSQADCVIYDRLIDPALLKVTKETCERIYVGKENCHHILSQDKIIELIIEKSKQYRTVVRLKGGDSYVFGRGGEEGIALYNSNIPFEVIPGIPSFIGGLAYAGIPITHRGVSMGIHILTAHGKNNEPLNIDFSTIQDNETTVFMMGLSKLEEIVSNLLNFKPATFPIALISNGTTIHQKVLISTLGNIIKDYQQSFIESPCLIVVGNVVDLHKQLDFYSRKPTIAFPRVSNEESSLYQSLVLDGYQVNQYYVSSLKRIKNDFPDLKKYTHILFSSKFGVDCFMAELKRNKVDFRNLASLKFCVIGKSTGNQLIQYGIYPDYCPEYYTSQDLCTLLLNELDENSSLLICKVEGEVEKWNELKNKFKVETLDLYKNVSNNIELDIQEKAIVFTCSSAVHETLSKTKLKKDTVIYSIGPKTSQTIESYGYTCIQSKQADFASLVECIESTLKISK